MKDEGSWGDLPTELWLRVLGKLPLEDVCRTQRACKRLRDLVNEGQSLWRELFEATFGAAASGGGGGAPQEVAGAGRPGRDASNAGQGEQQGQRQQPGSSSGHPAADTAAAGLAALPAAKRRRGGPAAPACSSGRPAGSACFPPAASLPAPEAVGADTDWRALFRSRFAEEARRQGRVRQARRLRAEGKLQLLRREVHQLAAALQREHGQLPALRGELAAARRARELASAAALAQVYWQPQAVQEAHGRGVATQQLPLDAAAREESARQRLAVAELEARKLAAALSARQARAEEAARKLAALQP